TPRPRVVHRRGRPLARLRAPGGERPAPRDRAQAGAGQAVPAPAPGPHPARQRSPVAIATYAATLRRLRPRRGTREYADPLGDFGPRALRLIAPSGHREPHFKAR